MKTLPNPVRKVNAHVLGLDVHKQIIVWVLMNRQGRVLASRRIRAEHQELKELVREHVGRKKAHAAFEASGCSMWVFDLLCELLKGAEYVHVAHARSIRAIANSQHKNDHNDAWWLAYLAYEGRLPEVYVPTGRVRELRLATRERAALVHERTRTMKRIRAHLRQAGKGRTLRAGSIRTVKSRDALLEFAEEMGGGRQIAVKQALAHIDALNLQVAGWEDRMEELSADLPAVQALQACIPGVGPVLSATIVAETGPIERFHSPQALARYAGLTPSERSSGGQQRNGGITKEGSAQLRWALVQAVMGARRCRKGPGLYLTHWVNLKRERLGGKKMALVAGARKVAEAIWRLFHLGECFSFRKPFGPLPAEMLASSKV